MASKFTGHESIESIKDQLKNQIYEILIATTVQQIKRRIQV